MWSGVFTRVPLLRSPRGVCDIALNIMWKASLQDAEILVLQKLDQSSLSSAEGSKLQDIACIGGHPSATSP